ncbi:uncharacterized protein LOC107365439 isoform X2 [Tetranychus urticae]|uniref:uncharacterized protein LOC107365439 isoform X2 n=1 Tax=Tetranychus urticae TaxID=32264 RepID=UPI000D649656|nr:uncharacterized protein LOC107365439 isoform X2 [Tetranychus urticae]
MAGQNSNSDNITFKVKHLNAYHGIVIDLNDARYESKHRHQQIFEQLESITGVPSIYTTGVIIFKQNLINLPPDVDNPVWVVAWVFNNQKAYVPGSRSRYNALHDIFSLNIEDGQRFHVSYQVSYDYRVTKRLSMRYVLRMESDVPEDGCGRGVCQYQCTENFFKRLKDLVCNDELNAKITEIIQPLRESGMWADADADKNFREFNIKQYFHVKCDVDELELRQAGYTGQVDLYLRTRG